MRVMQCTFTAILMSAYVASANAQYFLQRKPEIRKSSETTAQAISSASFAEHLRVSRVVNGVTLAVVPANSATGFTLSQLSSGIVLGRLTVDKKIFLGIVDSHPLEPGTYTMHLSQRKDRWQVAAIGADGKVKATNSEIDIHIDAEHQGPVLRDMKARIQLPPYARTVKRKGNIIPAADEGPGTVHGCQSQRCRQVRVCYDDPYTTDGSKVCEWVTVCDGPVCWN